MAGKLEREIKKKNPFASPQQAVVLGMLRTGDLVQYRRRRFFRDYGLTEPQYNVLRILRGEGGPLPSLEIADRMITIVPAITAVLDKLEQKGLVSRERCESDRRVWHVSLAKAGEKLLKEIDEPIATFEKRLCRGLSAKECRMLVELLEKARDGIVSEEDPQ